LDALAMLRIGASKHEYFPLHVVREPEDVVALDDLPGWIGDGSTAVESQVRHDHDSQEEKQSGDVGTLKLGAPTPLSPKKLYPCYNTRPED
ncbi:hypothetical protein JDV02_010379, partial [Purpureocillium takamizusanense]